MTKRRQRPMGARLCRFLDAMLTGTMHRHPEFLQPPGNRSLQAMAEELRELGWPVEMIVMPAPTPDEPRRCIAFFYIGDFSLDIAMGEVIDE